MKLGLISDIHCHNYALKAVIEANADVEQWYCAGDIVGLFPNINETIELIREYNIKCVKGNHEEALLEQDIVIEGSFTANESIQKQRKSVSVENYDFVKNLPYVSSGKFFGLNYLMIHDINNGKDKYNWDLKMIEDKFFKYDIVICGHTHYPSVFYLKRTLIINPGSLGFPVDCIRKPSFVTLDLETQHLEIKRADIDNSKMQSDILGQKYNHKLYSYLDNGYQWG